MVTSEGLTTAAGEVEVRGCRVVYRCLGDPGLPALMLIHGGAAHAGWWTPAANLLADRWRVILPDLSGHGDSGHRESYAGEVWAEEMRTILEVTGTRAAAVVGHSMGGLVALATAARSEHVDRLVLVDSRLPLRGLPLPHQEPKHYATAQEALSRFRLLPDRTVAEPTLLRELAVRGLIETADGWRWRFDPRARRRLTNEGVAADLARLRGPIGYLYGEESDMGGPGSVSFLEESLGRRIPAVAVPGAFHHVPLDQPARCAAAIEMLLAQMRS